MLFFNCQILLFMLLIVLSNPFIYAFGSNVNCHHGNAFDSDRKQMLKNTVIVMYGHAFDSTVTVTYPLTGGKVNSDSVPVVMWVVVKGQR